METNFLTNKEQECFRSVLNNIRDFTPLKTSFNADKDKNIVDRTKSVNSMIVVISNYLEKQKEATIKDLDQECLDVVTELIKGRNIQNYIAMLLMNVQQFINGDFDETIFKVKNVFHQKLTENDRIRLGIAYWLNKKLK